MAEPSAVHLARDAYIYVRQSTLAQTVHNTESLVRQYDLAGRAKTLGWPAHQIMVVDDDLGRSGASTAGRKGFADLVADVGLGKAGIVLSLECSRLARNNSDWYQLLDLCALTDTLIADGDGVYHPANVNDRLLLGLKGTMSEAELHLLRSRLNEGKRTKAARGQLRLTLPAGLDYDDDNQVIITPDEAVRAAITEVFRRFGQLGSARQVLVSLRQDQLLLPRRDLRTGRITWSEAGYPAVHDILTHPAYAGMFTYGRSKTGKRLNADGRVVTQQRRLPRDQWEVVITDHHPGYLSLEDFEANIARLAASKPAPAGSGGGAAREGRALLQGLLRCGRCGRIMQVAYHARAGTPAYLCGRVKQMYAGASICQRIGGSRLEKTVLDALLAALAPASLTATLHALADTETQFRQNLAVFERAVERARFEADRALRKYDSVEPENRLVARTLETTLEAKLTAVRAAENQLAAQHARRPVTLTEQEAAWITSAGADLRAVFEAPTTTNVQRKQLIRAVITEIVATASPPGDDRARTCDLRIIWQGGASCELAFPMAKTGQHGRATSEDTLNLVRRLAEHYNDTTIAQILGQQGRRTATGLAFTRTHVMQLRAYHHIPAYQPAPGNVTPDDNNAIVVTIGEAARELGVSTATVYRWLREGFITGQQLTPGAPWRIRIDQRLRDRIRTEAPNGWLPLDQAAKALGIARQTVLHKVQRRELNAIQITQGRRQGLRIQVERDQPGLFDTPR